MTTLNVDLDQRLATLLHDLGRTHTEESVAYDTAWAAKLVTKYPNQGFERAVTWLRQHQHADGSWGSAAMHYHDRCINTLAAMNALKVVGAASHGDEARIRAGQDFLWSHYRRLIWDSNDTVNYSGLSSMLVREAESLGLHVPSDLYPKRNSTEKKLAALRHDPGRWHGHPLTLSLEWLQLGLPEARPFIGENGSIGCSPAATAAMLLNSQEEIPEAVAYLQSVILPDGGLPPYEPLDIFDISWTLKHLIKIDGVTPDHPEVRRCLDFLWSQWSPQNGVGCTSFAKYVVDLDDTAVTFSLLKWGGYPVEESVFSFYEGDDHFRCYVDEADHSLSVHIRTLAALEQVAPTAQVVAWRQKIVKRLQAWHETGQFKSDKWHASQYYLSALAIKHLAADYREMVEAHYHWIVNTQQADGGWGEFGFTTAEETAYCLQALLHWDKVSESFGGVPSRSIERAVNYLQPAVESTDFVPLWIAKTLHTPAHIVQAAILAALYGIRAR